MSRIFDLNDLKKQVDYLAQTLEITMKELEDEQTAHQHCLINLTRTQRALKLACEEEVTRKYMPTWATDIGKLVEERSQYFFAQAMSGRRPQYAKIQKKTCNYRGGKLDRK